MRRLLDCDGVLLDLIGGLAEATGFVQFAPCLDYNLFAGMDPDQESTVRRIMADPEFWRSLRPIPGARVRPTDRVVTKPWVACRGWADARYAALWEHYGVPSRQVVVAEDKSCISGALLVDDDPSNLRAWAAANPSGEVMLYGATYNVAARSEFEACQWYRGSLLNFE